MCPSSRLRSSFSTPCFPSPEWPRLILLPNWFCLFLMVASVLAWPQTSYAQTVTTLHSFVGPDTGTEPVASFIQASDGKLYGTTTNGGFYSLGTVFSLDIK